MTILTLMREYAEEHNINLKYSPPTADIMQAIVIADKPYGLMDPGDYSELCLIIQYCVSTDHSTVDLENVLCDWEASDGPHFDEAEYKPLFTEHVLAILGLS